MRDASVTKPLELVSAIPVSAMSAKRRVLAVRRLGRQGKLSPAVLAAVVNAVASGATAEASAQAAGVSSRTLRRWRERGADGEAPYADLEQQLAEVTATRLVRLSSIVMRGAVDDPRLALEILSRLDPATWGKREQLALSGPTGGPVQLQTVIPDWSKLDDAQKDQLAALLDLALPRRQVEIAGQMVDVDRDE